jgi:hypothetical protein
MRATIATALLLLTAFPALSRAAAAEEASLERGERAISELERLGDGECPPTFSIPRLLRDVSAGALKPSLDGESARLGVRLYYFCSAFTRHDPALCGALSTFAGSYTYDGADNVTGGMRRGIEANYDWTVRCRTSLDKSGLAKAKISGDPRFREVCRAFFLPRQYVRPDAIDAACEILDGDISDLPKACGRLVPLFMDKITTDYCVANIGPFVGDRGSCGPVKQPYSRAACLGHADYADFVRGADAAACAASPFCLMMRSGRPQDCEAFLKEPARAACRDRYLPEYVLEKGAAAAAEARAVAAGIEARPEPALSDDALLERAIRLLLRWELVESRAMLARKP